jgi:hypothetical protein
MKKTKKTIVARGNQSPYGGNSPKVRNSAQNNKQQHLPPKITLGLAQGAGTGQQVSRGGAVGSAGGTDPNMLSGGLFFQQQGGAVTTREVHVDQPLSVAEKARQLLGGGSGSQNPSNNTIPKQDATGGGLLLQNRNSTGTTFQNKNYKLDPTTGFMLDKKAGLFYDPSILTLYNYCYQLDS